MICLKGFSRLTWQDVYYDGFIDDQYETFDEDSQKIIRFSNQQDDEVVHCKKSECTIF